jgi:hypothetical protein
VRLHRFYPEHVRVHAGASNRKATGEADTKRPRRSTMEDTTNPISLMTRFTVVLNKVEHLPAVMTLTQFLQPPLKSASTTSIARSIGSSDEKDEKMDAMDGPAVTLSPLPNTRPVISDGTPRVAIDALRLIELTERTSVVMKVSAAEELMHRDTLISVLRTFGHLNRIPVSSALSIVPRESFSSSVASHARDTDADLVVIPWSSAPSAIEESSQTPGGITAQNPFDAIFGGRSAAVDKATSMFHSQFIRRVFVESPTDVALFIDRGLSPLETSGTYGQHVFLPFFGGPDDRLALAFVVQLCVHPAVSATVVRVRKTEGLQEQETRMTEDLKAQQVAASLAANNMTVHSVSITPTLTSVNRNPNTILEDGSRYRISPNQRSNPPSVRNCRQSGVGPGDCFFWSSVSRDPRRSVSCYFCRRFITRTFSCDLETLQ